jgi:hypothetical protein
MGEIVILKVIALLLAVTVTISATSALLLKEKIEQIHLQQAPIEDKSGQQSRNHAI